MSKIIQKRFRGESRKPALPMDFGVKLIEKESELERNCSIEVVQDLVQIYTEAVEYYSYIKDNKSYDYQDRMHKMFLRPDVINAMKKNRPSTGSKTPTVQERKAESEKKRDEQGTLAKDLISNPNSKTLNRIIDYQKLRNLEVAKKAVTDFKSQDRDLAKRLDSRKKSMLTKSMDGSKYLNISSFHNRTLKDSNEESDIQTSIFFKLMEEDELDIELDLEKIMEKYCNEKAKRMAEVQVKYETQIKDIEGEGYLMEQIRQQARKEMQNELNAINNEIDFKRSEEILLLKNAHRKNSIILS
jgi:hypothetical protein